MTSTRELLSGLVAYPTVAGEDNVELIAYLAGVLEATGAAVDVGAGTRPGAFNLHAVLGPADAAGGMVLAAHSDVAAVEGQPWSHDPFSVVERDGRLHGRGTADMKAFIAAAVASFAAADTRALRQPVHLTVSSDEELGCLGVGPLLDRLRELPARPRAVIVGEPTALRVATRHKGKSALRAVFRGRAAHSSLAPRGVNAVAYAARFAVELLELQSLLEHEAMDALFEVPYATVGIGPIAGGVSVNIVPDRCRLDIEVRSLPDQVQSRILGRIEHLARELQREMRDRAADAGVTLEPLSSYPALSPDGDGAFARWVADLAGTGADLAVDFGTEAGLYQQALGVPVVVCGPGSMTQAHRADEYVAVDQLEAAERLLTRVVASLAG